MKNWIYIQFSYEYDELADVLAEFDDQNLQLPIRQPGSPNDVPMVIWIHMRLYKYILWIHVQPQTPKRSQIFPVPWMESAQLVSISYE